MKKNFTLPFLVAAFLFIKPGITKAQVNVQDSLALVNLYKRTDGPNWNFHDNWLTTAPVKTWLGITVQGDRVTGINMNFIGGNNLSGTLPSSLGNLTELTGLFLYYNNKLHGSIPPELGKLTKLTVLYLHDNNLSGSIPSELGNLTNLNNLDLSYNRLSGSLPSELGNLTNLNNLDLSANHLSGNIPPELGNLTNLNKLDLSWNSLSGSILPELGNLTNLDKLIFSYNHLNGIITPELGNLNNLNYLHLDNNQLSGGIPPELGKLTNLYSLDLSRDSLSGKIPIELCNLDKLNYLRLDNNQLSGNIPPKLGKLTNLNSLCLNNNQLSGHIPRKLVRLTNLYSLCLNNNQLSGKIPSELGNLFYLEVLNLADNKLRDSIPSSLGNLTRLLIFDLSNNDFNFDGIEALAQRNLNTFKYWNQRRIDIHQNNNTLSVYAGGTLPNNIYKWYKDGFLAATINGDSTFTPTAGGAYRVQVTNSIATELTLYSNIITFSALTASQQNNIAAQTLNENNFSVYPNPAKSNVTFVFKATGKYTLKLTDVNGTVLQTKTGVGVNNKNTLRLDVSKYATGIYFITLSNDQKQLQTLKLNKQ